MCLRTARQWTPPDSAQERRTAREETTERKPRVGVSRDGVVLNGNPMKMERFKAEILRVLTQKKREVDKVVVLKSKPNTPYERWIEVSDIIQKAGGIITLQLEEQRTVSVD